MPPSTQNQPNQNPLPKPQVVAPIVQPKQPLLMPIFVSLFVLIILLAAFLFNQNQQLKSQLAKSTIPNVPTETDTTASWPTYTSDIMGISFKYPPSYNAPEEHDSLPNEVNGQFLSLISPLNTNHPEKVVVLQDGELKIEILVTSAKAKNTSLDCYKDQGGEGMVGSNTYQVAGSKIDSVVWEGMGTGELICLVNNTKRYIINKYPAQTIRQSEFAQILSTFKFIDATKPKPTTKASSTSYADPTFGYQITIPSGWSHQVNNDAQDIPTLHLRKTTSTKAQFSTRYLPEIYLGGLSVYSTFGGVCFNQSCKVAQTLDYKIAQNNYSIPIIEAKVNDQLDYYAFQIKLSEGSTVVAGFSEPLFPYVTASFKSEAEKLEILQVLSTFSL